MLQEDGNEESGKERVLWTPPEPFRSAFVKSNSEPFDFDHHAQSLYSPIQN